MGLPDRLNENPSGRFASSPYAGPLYTPSEARAELARRQREKDAAERARREAANYETKVSADEFGIETQQAGGLTLPKVATDPSSGASSLEYKTQELTDTQGRQRKMNKAGRLEPVQQGVVQYLPGDSKTEGMADPSILYRVERAPEEIGQEGYDMGMRRPRKVEPVGRMDLLTDSTIPEVQFAARQNMITRNQSIYKDADTLLGNREAEAKNQYNDITNQMAELKARQEATPLPEMPKGDEATALAAITQENERRANEMKALEAQRLEASKRAVDFGKQRISLQNLQKDAAHVEFLNRAVANARSRGEDPNKDPIVNALKESYANLRIQAPEIENPMLAGSMVFPTRGPMVDPGEGSPEAAAMQERQGFMETASQQQAKTLADVKAQIEERKRKAEPIIQNAQDRMVEFNLKRTTRDRLADKYNALLGAREEATREDANLIDGQLDGLERIIGQMDKELDVRQEDTVRASASAEAEKEFANENAAMMEEAGKQKIAEGYRKASEQISAQKKREEVATPPALDQRPAQIDKEINSIPEEQLPQKQAELIEQGVLPPEAAKQSLGRNLFNQLVKGTFAANQRMMYAGLRSASAWLKSDPRMPTGIVDMILNPADTGWLEEAAEAAKANAEWFDKTFPTDEAFNQSYVGGVAKGISELPAQFAPYLAAGGLGGWALGGLYNFSYLMDEAYQRYAGNPEFEKLNEAQKANFAATYAMPAAVLDTFADKVTLGVFSKLIGKPVRSGGDILRTAGHLAVSGGTEGGTEVAQDAYLQKLGEAYDLVPESELFTKETAKTFAIAATVGFLAPVTISGGRRVVMTAQGALDNRQQEKLNRQAAELTSDIPLNGWAGWMGEQEKNYTPVLPEGQQLLGVSARTSPLNPFNQLRGKVPNILIEKGTDIDAQIAILEQQAARTKDRGLVRKLADSLKADERTPKLRQLQNLYMQRSVLASAAQNELKAREAVLREIQALPTVSTDGSYNPRASALAVAKFYVESPALTEAELKLKIGKDPLFTKDMAGNIVPSQKFIDEVGPQVPSLEPFISSAKTTAADMGATLEPERGSLPETAPLVATPEQQMARTTGERLKGATPAERMTDYAKRISSINQSLAPTGMSIQLELADGKGLGFKTVSDPKGVRIVLSKEDFKELEGRTPEEANRALNEEIFHAADRLSKYMEADKLGVDREAYYQQERTKLYSDLAEVAKTDQDILAALSASADIYFRGKQDIVRGDRMVGVEDIIKRAEELEIPQWRLMAEFLRQYKTRRRLTEAKVEAAGGKTESLMAKVTEYVKGIYRMLQRFSKGLARNPELKAVFDGEMRKIDEILNMQGGQVQGQAQQPQGEPQSAPKSQEVKFAPGPEIGNRPDAIAALQALGYKKKEAEKMVAVIDPQLPSGDIVRGALGQTKKVGGVYRPPAGQTQPQQTVQPQEEPREVLASTWYPNPQMQIPEDQLYNPPPERSAEESAAAIEAELGQKEKIVKSPQGAEALKRQLLVQQRRADRNARRRARRAGIRDQAALAAIDPAFTPELRNVLASLYAGSDRLGTAAEKLGQGANFSALDQAERDNLIEVMTEDAEEAGAVTQARADLVAMAAETRSQPDKAMFLKEAKQMGEYQELARQFLAAIPRQRVQRNKDEAKPAAKPEPETAPKDYKVFTQNYPNTVVVGGDRIVDLSELQDMEGTEIQPRARRQRKGYDQNVESIAMNLNPEQLMPGTNTGDGAPVVLKGTTNPYRQSPGKFDIISGHGRTKALRRVYDAYPERANAYREMLLQKFPQLRQQILAAKMPVVVTEMNLGESLKASNAQTKTKADPRQFLRRLAVRANPDLAPEELAVADAREAIEDPRLNMIRQGMRLLTTEGRPAPGNEEGLRRWFDVVGSQKYLDSRGNYTEEFENRVRAALFAASLSENGVYRDIDLNVIGIVVEAERNQISQMADALMHAAPSLRALRVEAAELFPDDVDKIDPMIPIAAGLRAFLQERKAAEASGRTPPSWNDIVDNINSQLKGMEGAKLSQSSIAIFGPIAEFKDSPAKLRAYLSGVTNMLRIHLREYREMGGVDMFGNPIPLADNMEETIVKIAGQAAAVARDDGTRARLSEQDDEDGLARLKRLYDQYENMTEDNVYVTDRDLAEETRKVLDNDGLPNSGILEAALQEYEVAEMEDRMYYGQRSGEDMLYLDRFMKELSFYLSQQDEVRARTSLPSDGDYLSRRSPEPRGEEIQPDLFGEVEVPETRSSEFTPAMRDAYLHYFPTGETSAAVRALAKEFVNSDSLSKGFTFEAFVDLVDDILIEVIPQAFRAAKTPMAYLDRAIKNNLRTRLAQLEERFISLDAPPSGRQDAPPNEEGVTTGPADIEVSGELDSRRAGVVRQGEPGQEVEAPSTEAPQFMDTELSKALYTALDRLPKEVREAFMDSALMGKTPSQIARERGLGQGSYQTIANEIKAAQRILGEYIKTLSPEGAKRFKEAVRSKAEDTEFGLQARLSNSSLDAVFARTSSNMENNIDKLSRALGEDGGVVEFTSVPQARSSRPAVVYSIRPSAKGWTAIPLRHDKKIRGDVFPMRTARTLDELLPTIVGMGGYIKAVKTMHKDSQRRAFNLGEMAGKFYSAAAEAIREKMPAQATRDQIENILRATPGVKADELRWLGLDDMLERLEALSPDKKIPKESVIDAIVLEASSMFFAADADVSEYANWSSRSALVRGSEITPLRRKGEKPAMAGTGLYLSETEAFLKNTTMDEPEGARSVHSGFQAQPGTRYVAHNRTDVLVSASDKTEGLVIDELQQDAKSDTPFGIVPLQKQFAIEGRRQGSPYLMMFKIALARAVSMGKNWVGIVTGEAQSQRYGKGQYVDEIRVVKFPSPEGVRMGRTYQGTTTDAVPIPVGTTLYSVSGIKDGKVVAQRLTATAEQLEEILGKKMTERVVGSAVKPMQIDPRIGSALNAFLMQELGSSGSGNLPTPAVDPGGSAMVFKERGLTYGPAGLLNLYDRTIPQDINKYVSKWGGKLRPDSVNLGIDKQFVGSRPDAVQARKTFLRLGAILSGYSSLEEAISEWDTDPFDLIGTGPAIGYDAEEKRWGTGWGTEFDAEAFVVPTEDRAKRFRGLVNLAYRGIARDEFLKEAKSGPAEQAMPDDRAWRNVQEAVATAKELGARISFNVRTDEPEFVGIRAGTRFGPEYDLPATYLSEALNTMERLREINEFHSAIADAESVMAEISEELNPDQMENARWRVKHFTKQIDNALAQLDTTGAYLLGGVIENAKTTSGVPIYRLDITPQIKADVEAGQALFARMSGATEKETKDIGELFTDFKKNQDEEEIHHLFDAPTSADIVRTQERVTRFITPKEADKTIQGWMDHVYKQGKDSLNGKNRNGDKIVLSLFDYTGEWSKPWEEAGYQVYQFDTQLDEESGDVNNFSVDFFNNWFNSFDGQDVYAVLAACPCTDFAVSGARHFAAKDQDGRTQRSIDLVMQTLNTIEYFKPAVWALENPVGRIEKLTGLPPWRMSFDPNHFGDPYTKKTLLWGRFNGQLPLAPVEPTQGSKMWKQYGGKSLKTKNARSVTPEGFAYAFFMANNFVDNMAMGLANKYDRLNPRVFQMAAEYGLTEEQISYAIDDIYYLRADVQDESGRRMLDDRDAEKAIMALMAGKKKARKPIAKLAPTPEPATEPTKFIAEYPRELFKMEEVAGRGRPAAEPDVVLAMDGEDGPGMEQMSLFARLSSIIEEISPSLVSSSVQERTEAELRLARSRSSVSDFETPAQRLERFYKTALVPEALEIEFGFRTPAGQPEMLPAEKVRRRREAGIGLDGGDYEGLRRIMLRRNPALLREILSPSRITPGTPEYRKGQRMANFARRAFLRQASLGARLSLDRPESFEEVRDYLASEFTLEDVPTLLAEAQRGVEIGRGDLANPAAGDVRRLVNAVDEARKQSLTRRPDLEVEKAAQELANDPNFITRILRVAKNRGTVSDQEVLATRILIGRYGKAALLEPDSKEGREAAVLIHAYRRIGTEAGRAFRQMQDSVLTPAERHLEFLLTTILSPRGRLRQRKQLKRALEGALLQSDKDARIDALIREIERLESLPGGAPDTRATEELRRKVAMLESVANQAGSERAALEAEIQNLKADLAIAVARANDWFNYAQGAQETSDAQIAMLQAQLAQVRSEASYEEILASDAKEKLAQVNETLAKLGTSYEQLMAETDTAELRTGKIAKQILSSVKMSKEEREAVELVTLGYDPGKIKKVSAERIAELMKQLRAEDDRRFKRFAESRPTQAELQEFLRRIKDEDGTSVMARLNDDSQRMTPEEAMEQIYRAFGHVAVSQPGKLKALDRKGKTNLFDLRKPEHAYVLASGIVKADWRFDNAGYELYTSLILSGLGTQLVNFVATPFAPISIALFRGLEVFSVYATQSIARRRGDPLNDNTTAAYRTLGEATKGAFGELFAVWRGVVSGFLPAISFANLAWETEAGFFMDEATGYGGSQDAQEKFGGVGMRQAIPGKFGKFARIPLRAMIAADEFSKAWRAYMHAGANAYRMGKEQGLAGEALSQFVSNEVGTPRSTAWQLAGMRAERETYTRQIPGVARSEKRKPKGLGDVIGILPGVLQRLNMQMQARRDEAYEEGGALGIAERAALAFLSTFNMFLKTTYNIAREGNAYVPVISGINILFRYGKGKGRNNKSGAMSAEDYDMFIQRISQMVPLTILLPLIAAAVEGDDDDETKFILITGSPDKRPGARYLTRFGNTPYIIRIGGTTIDYSRIEPLATALGTTADGARAFKEAKNGGLAATAIARFAQDLILSPLEKTFGKSRKDLVRMGTIRGDVWQGWQVLRERIMPFSGVGAPIVRKFLTAPDDIVRDTETEPFGRRAMMDMVIPNPEFWQSVGMLKPGEDLLPPKYNVDGTIRTKVGTQASRSIIPGQGVYQQPRKSLFEQFLSAYNTRYPDARWNPEPPGRAIEEPITGKKIYLSTQQYALMRGIASKAIQQRLSNAISASDLRNPTPKKRNELAAIISDANSQARKIVAQQVLKGRIEEIKAGAEAGPR